MTPAEATILLPLLEKSVFVSTSPGGPNKMTHSSDLSLEHVGKLSDYSDSTNQARVLIAGAARPSDTVTANAVSKKRVTTDGVVNPKQKVAKSSSSAFKYVAANFASSIFFFFIFFSLLKNSITEKTLNSSTFYSGSSLQKTQDQKN